MKMAKKRVILVKYLFTIQLSKASITNLSFDTCQTVFVPVGGIFIINRNRMYSCV